jgi:catechol 2,3-dioxygenase-like lactoylglutathione lyase family enzyme
MRPKLALATLLAALPLASPARTQTKPKIFQIAKVQIYVTNLDASHKFYSGVTGIDVPCDWCQRAPAPLNFVLPSHQILELIPTKTDRTNFLGRITFTVDDLQVLKRLLAANHISFQENEHARGILPTIFANDPDGHELEFATSSEYSMQLLLATGNQAPLTATNGYVAQRLIHAGFIVKNQPAMEHFYKDILGFHVYWHGGMQDNRTDWLDMQVPDGTDWVEFMLNIPDDANKHLRGVMNHIALGVPSVQRADQQLLDSHLPLPINEKPKIGRDGKWQLNLYDPDDTRVELMDFTPTEKPCCSDFTGPHPKP